MSVTAQQLIDELQVSGTGEEKLLHMQRMIDANPSLTAKDLVSKLENELAVAEGRRESPVVPAGTLRKLDFLARGEEIPLERSRISATMLQNPNASLPRQQSIGPVSGPEPAKPVPQTIGPESKKGK